MKRISIIVPVLNEAARIGATLAALAPLRGAGHEVIVVDGGSTDGTPVLAGGLADRVLAAARGRAAQMNAGADVASGDVLLFLHADTVLPAAACTAMLARLSGNASVWGRFDVRIDGSGPLLGIVAAAMNWRSRLTGIATGDQAIFVLREVFAALGGYPSLPLMEDIVLCSRLRKLSRPLCLRDTVTTSGRRWKNRGVLATVVLMWWLRLRFYFGAEPESLARSYDGVRLVR